MPSEMHFDALKIYYYVILETDDLKDVTLLQGFSISWPSVEWALTMIARLPADVLEPTSKIDDIVAQRMGGFRSLCWAPLNIGALESLSTNDLSPFVVLFSGERTCAARVRAWQAQQQRPVLHISNIDVQEGVTPAAFTIEVLRDYCLQALNQSPQLFSDEQRAATETALPQWMEPQFIPSGLKQQGHNVTIPNYLSLLRSGRSVEPGEHFIGSTEKEYTDLILETAKAVIDVRDQIGFQPFHAMTLLRPALILAEPALYRINYRPIEIKDHAEERMVRQTLRLIQKQKGLHNWTTNEFASDLQNSPASQAINPLTRDRTPNFCGWAKCSCRADGFRRCSTISGGQPCLSRTLCICSK
ncbi:hypothetical protein [Bradyrhizobium sp. CB3481]|uniref:hypothetical protein n=1 Tax=Bradyrhizobium sp. CB3481 TaxID=3039158 RepID=UPI0024B164A6|nr:hypothetical protein [Bradyrhizobium sp. CB3481]WFU16625.1 hypothetical protein QA643_37805 [Bradyrhizobium sp. CB3481]